MQKIGKQLTKTEITRMYIRLYETEKIQKGTFLFESFMGRNMVGDPLGILTHVLEENLAEKIYCVMMDEDYTVTNKLLQDDRIIMVRRESLEYFSALATVETLINNVTFPPEFIKKEGQVYINTWHGTPYKTLGKDMNGSFGKNGNVTRNFLQADAILHGCKYTKDIIENSYDIKDVWLGNAIYCSPRLDLCRPSEELDQFFNKKPEEEVVLVCPTWKGSEGNINTDVSDIEELYHELALQYPDKKIYLKLHWKTYELVSPELKKVCIPDAYDFYQILYYVDTIITDYSSLFFDAAYFNKKIINYIPDYEEYTSDRGLYLSQDELPGSVCYTVQEVIDAVASPTKDLTEFNKRFNMQNLTTDELLNYDFKKRQKKTKKNVLFYVGNLTNNGITTSFVNLSHKWDYEKYNLILIEKNTFGKGWSDLGLDIAQNRINENVKIYFRNGSFQLEAHEASKLTTFKKNPSKEKVEDLKYLYQREAKRLYGDVEFDTAIDFNGYVPFWSALVGSFDCNKYIFQHNDMHMERYKKEPDGKLKHYANLSVIFNLYNEFTKIIAVSEDTANNNAKNLSEFYPVEKKMALENFINEDEIFEKSTEINHKVIKTYSEIRNKRELVEQEEENFYQEYSNLGFEKDEDKEWILFTYMGRISVEKGQVDFIKSMPHLLKEHKNIQVIFVGTGPLEKEAKDLVEELNLENHVIFTGHVANPYPYVKISDYLILLSKSEGQPMVLLEGAVLGKKMIGSDIPGCRSVLKGKYGMIIEDNYDLIKATKNYFAPISQLDAVEYNKAILDKYDEIINEEKR